MARLPTPGGDSNNWGNLLNDFLSQAHAADGTLKTDSVGSAQIASGSVVAASIGNGSVTASKLDGTTQTALSKATSSVQSVNSQMPNGAGNVTLTPSDIGAPTAIAQLSDVNASGASDQQVLSFDALSSTWSAATVSNTPINDASTVVKGIVQLAGDLAGTSNAPVVNKLRGVTVPSAAPASGQVLTATGATIAAWQTPATAPVTSVAGKTGVVTLVKTDVGLTNVDNTSDVAKPISTLTQTALNAKEATVTSGTTTQYYRGDKSWQTLDKATIGLGNVDNTSDVAKPISTLTQTALNTKAPLASPTFTGTVTVPTPTGNTDAATKAYVDTTASSGTPDANTTTKGKVQLAGDLAGTAALPVVDKVKGVTVSGTAPTTGQVLTATGVAAASWQTPSGGGDPAVGGDLTGTASNAQIAANAVGTAEIAANAVTTAKILDANVTTTKIADASVTEPKLNISNAPATNQVLSWNGTALAWTTPAAPTGGARTVTAVKTANYTASAGEYVIANPTAAGFTVTLPASAASGAWVSVKDRGTNSNAILIVPSAGDTIEDFNGSTSNYAGVSVALNTQAISMDFIYDGTSIWYRVG